jgi:beta-phosphoglucomutase-like phosphatase (HAD superfamily)
MSDSVSERATTLADLPAPGAILFDLDGTLVDTVGRRIEGWLAAFAELGIDADAARIGASGAMASGCPRGRGRGHGATLSENDRKDRSAAGELFSKLNVDPRLLPASFLMALLESAFPFVIATSSLGAQVTASLEALELPGRPVIVDGEHVEHAKPEPDLLLLAAERVDVAARDCWYVGDAVWDVLAAKAAGMIGLALPTGAVSSGQLFTAGAVVVVDELDELRVELGRRGLLAT